MFESNHDLCQMAVSMHSLACALQERIGEERENLERSIECCRKTLEISEVMKTSAMVPDTCPTFVCLGNAHLFRISGDRRENLKKAIKFFRRALNKTSEGTTDWNLAHMGLGNAFHERIDGETNENLKQALQHFDQCMSDATLERAPTHWATAAINSARVWQSRIDGVRSEHLMKAIHLHEQARCVFTQCTDPVKWATSWMNQSQCFIQLGRQFAAKGVNACHQALEVFAPASHPRDWALTQRNLGVALSNLDRLDEAIAAYDACLTVATPESDPKEYAAATRNRASILKDFRGGDRESNLSESRAQSESALRVFSRENNPNEFILAASTLADTLMQQGHLLKAILTAHEVLQTADEQLFVVSTGSNSFDAKDALRSAALAAVATVVQCHCIRGETDRALEIIDARHCRGLVELERVSQATSANDMSGMTYEDIRCSLGDDVAAAVWYVTDEFAGVFLVAKTLSKPSLWTYSDKQRAEINEATRTFHQHIAVQDFLPSLCDDITFEGLLQALSKALCMREIHDHLLRQNDQSEKPPHPEHSQVTRASGGNDYQAPNCSQLVIIPHGQIQGLPLDALCVTSDTVCLADVYTAGTMYSPSLSLYHSATARALGSLRLSPTGLLAVQNPTKNLPGSDQEVGEIVELLMRDAPGGQEPRVLAHGEASKEKVVGALKALADDGNTFAVHFSCHGNNELLRQWESSLVLAGMLCQSWLNL